MIQQVWDGDATFLTSSQGMPLLVAVRRNIEWQGCWSVDDGLVSNWHPSRAICRGSRWILLWNRTQPQRHLSEATPAAPARRLCVALLVLFARKSLSLEMHRNIRWLPEQPWSLAISRGSVFSPVASDMVYPPCSPTSRWPWQILSKAFPARLPPGKCNADPLYAQILVIFKGNSIIDLSTPGTWHRWKSWKKRRRGLVLSRWLPTDSGVLLSLHTLLLILQIESKKQFHQLTSPVASSFLCCTWMVHVLYSELTPPSPKSFSNSSLTMKNAMGEGFWDTRAVTGTGAGVRGTSFNAPSNIPPTRKPWAWQLVILSRIFTGFSPPSSPH